MLKELSCKQVAGEPRRRWLADEYFDLIVWVEPDHQPLGFQLCYDKPCREQALTWTRQSGFSHAGVDGGEDWPSANCTPILVAGGDFPAERVRREFLARSLKMDPQLRELVLQRLAEYGAGE